MDSILRRLLGGLETEWSRQGAAIVERLRPGLSTTQLDDVSAELGFPLPAEIRELWAWHDGTDQRHPRVNIGPGGYEFHSTEDVLREYRLNRQVHAESPEDPTDLYWRRHWLPFMTQGPQRLYVDASRLSDTGCSPVRLVTWEWEDYSVDRAPSLAAAVSMWIWLLSSGYYTWDSELCGWWTDDYSAIPLFARWTMA